jgi:hypothetical protein
MYLGMNTGKYRVQLEAILQALHILHTMKWRTRNDIVLQVEDALLASVREWFNFVVDRIPTQVIKKYSIVFVCLKGHGNEADFLGFCRNWFLIDPLHYLSSRSDLVVDSPTRRAGESLWNRYSNFLKFFIKLQHFKRPNQHCKGST